MQRAWLIWSMIFLLLWLVLYIANKSWRKKMIAVSLWTMPFGLTEPLFVPNYWNPPTLFDLAQKTGFDVESLIFTFAIGGIASVLYQVIYKVKAEPMSSHEKHLAWHRIHRFVLFIPFLVFIILATATNLNHIYCGIVAMSSGALATLVCRPDLKVKIWIGGLLFSFLYFLFFELLNIYYPGYVDTVWTFRNISGWLLAGVPLEELLFGFTFGMYWSSVYEHLLWYKISSPSIQNGTKSLIPRSINSVGKYTHHIVSALLVFSMIFSSVGYTAIHFACPNMSAKPGAQCPQCEKSVSKKQHTKDCCKPKVEHKVIKADFTNPHSIKTKFTYQQKILFSLILQPSFNFQSAWSRIFALQSQSYPELSSVEKCVLLSTIRI